MKPDINSDISLSVVTNVFCILRSIHYGLRNCRGS